MIKKDRLTSLASIVADILILINKILYIMLNITKQILLNYSFIFRFRITFIQ